MSANALLGLDIGTTSTKAGLFGVDGTELALASFPTSLIRRGAGCVEQDPRELEDSALAAIRQVLESADLVGADVAALSVGGQMAGVMGINRAWEPATPYDSWMDSRCAPQLRRLERDHGDRVVELSGCPPMVDHAPKLMWWKEERPDEFAATARFIMPAAYVAGRLSGLRGDEAFIDATYLHFTGLVDARTGSWSPELLEALGIEPDKLPRIVEPWEVVGEVTRSAAEACGLRAGTPVVAGAGDTATGALGAGIVAPGDLLDTAGTASVLLGCVDTFAPDVEDRALISMRGVLPGQWMALSYVGGGGLCLPWLQRVLHDGESAEDEFGALLDGIDAVPPGAGELFFVPHLGGRVLPNAPALRGAWVGLSFDHEREHLVRAVLESVAFEYAVMLSRMGRLHPDVVWRSVRAIGGGARSGVWNAIKADALGLPVARVGREELAAYGSALIAGHGAGLIDDLAATAAAAPLVAPLEPAPDGHQRYVELATRYSELVDAMAALAGSRSAPQPETLA